jgi:hypothetical protein
LVYKDLGTEVKSERSLQTVVTAVFHVSITFPHGYHWIGGREGGILESIDFGGKVS